MKFSYTCKSSDVVKRVQGSINLCAPRNWMIRNQSVLLCGHINILFVPIFLCCQASGSASVIWAVAVLLMLPRYTEIQESITPNLSLLVSIHADPNSLFFSWWFDHTFFTDWLGFSGQPLLKFYRQWSICNIIFYLRRCCTVTTLV